MKTLTPAWPAVKYAALLCRGGPRAQGPTHGHTVSGARRVHTPMPTGLPYPAGRLELSPPPLPLFGVCKPANPPPRVVPRQLTGLASELKPEGWLPPPFT